MRELYQKIFRNLKEISIATIKAIAAYIKMSI